MFFFFVQHSFQQSSCEINYQWTVMLFSFLYIVQKCGLWLSGVTKSPWNTGDMLKQASTKSLTDEPIDRPEK